MKYYIISGEASGDLHAANLVKQLKKKDTQAQFRGWGGDLMQEQGVDVVKHYRDLAFMGFIEVVMNLRTILQNIKLCKADIDSFEPDVLILVDYPGFNLRIAEWAHNKNYKVYYYISPQIWAWKENRIKKIKKSVDEMFVILPFEQEFYAKHNYKVNFVGHPLLDAIDDFKEKAPDFDAFCIRHGLSKLPIIALLPGSRKQEISTMLPLMLAAIDKFKNYQFVIAGAPSQEKAVYEPFLSHTHVHLISGKTYNLLQQSTAALVTSGTATLETALFQVPEVVCYKGSWISYWIARQLVKIDYISLVNLIMDREVVKELIQSELNTKNITNELNAILPEGKKRKQLLEDYKALKIKLGGVGASETAASMMLKTLKDA